MDEELAASEALPLVVGRQGLDVLLTAVTVGVAAFSCNTQKEEWVDTGSPFNPLAFALFPKKRDKDIEIERERGWEEAREGDRGKKREGV